MTILETNIFEMTHFRQVSLVATYLTTEDEGSEAGRKSEMEFPDLGQHCSIPTCKQLGNVRIFPLVLFIRHRLNRNVNIIRTFVGVVVITPFIAHDLTKCCW